MSLSNTARSVSPIETYTLQQKRNRIQEWIPQIEDVAKRELFDIMKTYNIPFTKNTNGLFINLAYLEEESINCLFKHCRFFINSQKFTEESRKESKQEKEKGFVIDQSLLQECVRDIIKDSLSESLQIKLNKKLSVFEKESNWKHQPLPNTHTKNAELGKVRGRISRKKNNHSLLKRCRDISLYLSKNETSGKDADILSGTNELSLD